MLQQRLVLLICIWNAIGSTTALAQGPQFRWRREPGSIALVTKDKTVWQFRYGNDIPKPMFHPLALSDGTVLTWNSPPDHPWHHALWFSWKYLNHVNYWESDPREPRLKKESAADKEPGGLTEWKNVRVRTGPGANAAITLDLSYHEPGKPPLLSERRAIRASQPDASGTYYLDWTMTFTAGKQDVDINRTPVVGDKDGVPWGGYAGLSIRFARELTDARTATTKEQPPAAQPAGLMCETGSTGVDYSGAVEGREAGVAILDHPANLHAPTPWYLIIQPKNASPFHFAEAALIYYKPYLLKAGKSFTLRYRVAVHTGRWDRNRLLAEDSRFVKEAR
ncbi:MAG: PmoA family protein [Bryobacterales bacterium]|nr:PmoA family protein [Bryobacterales bacterium]